MAPRHHRPRLVWTLNLGLSLALGCDAEPGFEGEDSTEEGDDDDSPVALAEAAAWAEASLAEDPLAAHQPDEIVCAAGSWGEEQGVLELSTAACNYLSLEQPLQAGLAVGDRVAVDLWWAALFAPEPAEGHLALLVEGVLVWETFVEIPAKADARSFEFLSPVAAAPGAALTFHLHNHGQNNWTLAAVERLPRG